MEQVQKENNLNIQQNDKYNEIIDTKNENQKQLKFVVISDTHCQHEFIDLPQGDVLIHCGDFSYTGEKEELQNFHEWLLKQKNKFKYVIIIAGNHDCTIDEEYYLNRGKIYPKKFLHTSRQNCYDCKALIANENWIYLEDDFVEIEGIKIYGSPWTPESEKIWNKIPDNTDILITHGPPKYILDKIKNFKEQEINVGCQILKQQIDRVQPKFHLFGHIHDTYGVEKEKNTFFVNASICDEEYKPINKPVVFYYSI
ncbi:hypothetical protein PPERSA_00236 [Pseudocohnilembus persalinus]|uniref:Calcineurin-like phosphoesterase domain-containing protein n=1 Tax=Pseudocohnilembus persalinus TaxID=266149 RepID=A0A0V0Q8Q9_PSEPJ|nr:hypothetical protein PPERSA_00236 [Pseudocohnilembus persalinus]|eukprot:KRW98648.1 hypothetical protein PPERSA_00236 [Pseudocohnilembus persalinus]